MGPERFTYESVSAYRMRYARYCLRWIIILLLPLLVLLAFAPSVGSGPVALLLMFLYVGLPLGLAVAAIAAFGFMVGGFWSSTLEMHPHIARLWPRTKSILRALVVVPVICFGFYAIARGFLDKEVLIFTRGKGLPVVSLAQEPSGFLFNMVVWCAVTVGLAVYLYKELRRAFTA